MMKKIYSLILGLLLASISQAQTLEITYLAKGIRQPKEDIQKAMLSERTFLILEGNNSSYFYSENFERRNKIFTTIQQKSEQKEFVDHYAYADSLKRVSHPEFLGDEFIKGYPQNGNYEVWTKLGIEHFHFTQKNLYNWTFDETQSKQVLGYKCNMAITKLHGRTFRAWYTEDIPIAKGPYKFSGLPGLILEVSSLDSLFSFEAVGIRQIDKPKVTEAWFKKEARTIAFKDFMSIRTDYYQNPLKQFENQGFSIKLSPDFDKTLETSKRYIFLEEAVK